MIVSAATICWGDGPQDDAAYEAKSAAYAEVFAPWRDWLREGLLDLNCPMTYFDYAKHPDYWRHWSNFVKDHQYGHLSAMGVGTWINTVPNSLAEIVSTRQPTGQGNAAAGVVLFSYAGTDSANDQEEQYNQALYSGLGQPDVFTQDVPPPPMPWLDKPKVGAILGIVLQTSGLAPADGAIITLQGEHRPGSRRTVACDGNGFFAFTELPPDNYRINFHGGDPTMGFVYPVKAGDATRITVGGGFTTNEVTGISKRAGGAPVTLGTVLVTNGSERLGDDFYVADDFGRPALRVHAPGLVPPMVAGDIVAISGTLHHTKSGAVILASTVRQLGARLIP